MPTITIKKDPSLLAFAAFLVLVFAALVWRNVVTWKEAAAVLGAALALPGLFGAAPPTEPKGAGDGGP